MEIKSINLRVDFWNESDWFWSSDWLICKGNSERRSRAILWCVRPLEVGKASRKTRNFNDNPRLLPPPRRKKCAYFKSHPLFFKHVLLPLKLFHFFCRNQNSLLRTPLSKNETKNQYSLALHYQKNVCY